MRSSIYSIIALLFIQLSMLPANAEGIYKWKDKSGKTQYGDKPPQGTKAEPLKMPALTVIENYGQQWNASPNEQYQQEDRTSQAKPKTGNYSSLSLQNYSTPVLYLTLIYTCNVFRENP